MLFPWMLISAVGFWFCGHQGQDCSKRGQLGNRRLLVSPLWIHLWDGDCGIDNVLCYISKSKNCMADLTFFKDVFSRKTLITP